MLGAGPGMDVIEEVRNGAITSYAALHLVSVLQVLLLCCRVKVHLSTIANSNLCSVKSQLSNGYLFPSRKLPDDGVLEVAFSTLSSTFSTLVKRSEVEGTLYDK